MSVIPKSVRLHVAPDAQDSRELAEPRLREIESTAAVLLNAFWREKGAPLDLDVFLVGTGVAVRERGGPPEPMYPHEGRLLRLDGRAVIEVSRALDPPTRRLMVAHALGHHLLGHDPVPPEIPEHFGPSCRSAIEREATRFALALLMPQAAMLKGMEEGWVSVKRLAEGFVVPESCVRQRLLHIERHCRL